MTRTTIRLWRRATARTALRRLRLATGLVLFSYVTTHLLNHSLGNISIGAMQAGLGVQRWIWQGVIGTVALYVALTTHFLLALLALYERRHFGWRPGEMLQLVLGLCIPFLLLNHIFVTRIALAQFGILKAYPQELYSFWVASPQLGVQQVAVLITAWIHGCLGINFWLRLKRFYGRWAPALLCGAVLLPVLALLGFLQGGRAVLAVAHDKPWHAANLAASQVGTATQNAALRFERNTALLVAGALVVLVLLARLFRAWHETHSGIIRVSYPGNRSARVPLGFSVLEASLAARVPHASLCGGRARCSTCRVRVIAGTGRIPPPSPGEQAVLDRVGAGPLVRLACQLRPLGDITVVPLLPPHFTVAALRGRTWPLPGEERFIAALVIDMRNSTALAETRLPFDTVFIIDRFINAVAAAVAEAGGRANHFTGDGLIAIFGLKCGPDAACRQAVQALEGIGRRVAELNAVLLAEMSAPIRFGAGLHGSSVVVGEVGLAEHRVFTTIGEAANVATRLESLCKSHDCEAVISESVCQRSGLELSGLPRQEVVVRGREAGIVVRTCRCLAELPTLLAAEAGAVDRFPGNAHAVSPASE